MLQHACRNRDCASQLLEGIWRRDSDKDARDTHPPRNLLVRIVRLPPRPLHAGLRLPFPAWTANNGHALRGSSEKGTPMYTLGINAVYHDSAAALVQNGRLIAAAEEERFTHVKHGKRPIPFSTYEL